MYLVGAGEWQEEADFNDGPDALVVERTVGTNEAVNGLGAFPLGLREVKGDGGRLEAELQNAAVFFARV